MRSRVRSTLLLTAFCLAALSASRVWTAAGKEPLYDKKPMSHWLKALGDDDPKVSGKASDALRAIGAPAVAGLVEIVKDKQAKAKTRGLAISAVAYIWPDGKSATPVLVELTHDPDPGLRVEAASALIRLDPASTAAAISVLVDALGEKGDVAGSAAHALGALGPQAKAAVPALVKALAHDDRDTRLLAAFSLGRIGPAAKDAIPILEQIARDEHADKALRDNAQVSLRAIRGEISLQPH